MFANKTLFFLLVVYGCLNSCHCVQQNKSSHHLRRKAKNLFKNQITELRSYKSSKYHPILYPKAERLEYDDMTAYDTEYGGMVSNFSTSYDDSPPIYPNPEVLIRNNQAHKTLESNTLTAPDMDVPEIAYTDGDLKDHNIIDSVTYVYGINTCQVRNGWMILIFIACGMSTAIMTSALAWIIFSEKAIKYRSTSKLYPLIINLGTCLQVCTIIYVRAIVGVATPSQCEKIALLLHYTYLVCAVWIVLIAGSVAEYSSSGTVLAIKYHYLLAYGVPAVVVTFNYALSMEHYETKHYCWMSLEKGMMIGFMIPAMLLIVINTVIVILGLQSVNRKQNEIMSAKIQEFLDNHIAGLAKEETPRNMEVIDLYSAGSSRKNTDSSDTLDKDYIEDDPYFVAVTTENGTTNEVNHQQPNDEKAVMNMLYLENLSWKAHANAETRDLKAFLNLCLISEPFFAINWMMGVVAVENAASWPTPALYLVLVQVLYIYLAVTICTNLPIMGVVEQKLEPISTCQEIVTEINSTTTVIRTRSKDNIPLLDPNIQQPNLTPAPVDTISTISI